MSLLKLNNYIKDECKEHFENVDIDDILDDDNLCDQANSITFFYYLTDVTRIIGNDLETWCYIQTDVVEQDLDIDYSDFAAIANEYARGNSFEIMIKLREDLWKDTKNAINEKVPEAVTDLIFGFLSKPQVRYNYDLSCCESRSVFTKNKWVAFGDRDEREEDDEED